MTPLISVIIPTYNRATLIGETINSIIDQTYKNFELIIIDDGSTDNTEKIVKSFIDNRIKYIKTDNWGGPARPRNIGIKKAKGIYIAFCDDDDLWLPHKLERQEKIFADYSCGLCFTNYDYIDLRSKKINKKNTIKSHYRKLTFNKFFLSGGCIANSTVMIKRKVIETVGILNEDRRLIAMEDYHYWARIIYNYKPYYVDDVLMSYRVDSSYNSISPRNEQENMIKNIYLINSIKQSVDVSLIIIFLKTIKVLIKPLLKHLN